MNDRALRGRILYFTDDPTSAGEKAVHYYEDGLLVLRDGFIAAAGDASDLGDAAAGLPIDDHRPHLIMPGFIDTHVHYPQTQVIASYGAQLLDWLNTYTFPEEAKFADPDHAVRIARFFIGELLRNGTTTAAVYCTVHPQSVEAFFTESMRRNTRMIAGKVLMDRAGETPESLRDTPETAYRDSNDLIGRWHGTGRQLYAVTPRFAVTSSEAQMDAAGTLLEEHPDCYLQTHLSENETEIATVAALFPDAASYTDVYDRHRLLGRRSLFGHCIHLGDGELQRLHETDSVAVFCPTSNLFIGSGLFDLARVANGDYPVRVGIATDVGGGTSYSMLRTLAEGYKVLQLRGQNLPALDAFYRITLGNARALDLENVVGSFAIGAEADIVVLDSGATPAMAHRMETVERLDDELFVMMTLGDERTVRAVYVAGVPVEETEDDNG